LSYAIAAEGRGEHAVLMLRGGGNEHSIREFRLSQRGLVIGPPLKDFSGIFTGTPQYTGNQYTGNISPLLADDGPDAR